MKQALTLFALILTLNAQAQTNVNIQIQHDGLTRDCIVHLPPGHNPANTYALVINMHGLGSAMAQQQFYSQMDRVADTAGFIVAYPQGEEVMFQGLTQRHWNAGFGTGVDDLGFLDKLIDRVNQDYGSDLKRTYMTGMSNGGYMSYYFACQKADRVTAIASITGSMTELVLNNCDPSEMVPALQMHGTADGVVGFNGSPSIDEVVQFWVNHNTCPRGFSEEMIPDIDLSDNCSAVKRTWEDCDSKSQVWYYIIENGGHTWPGTFGVPQLGNTCGDFFASTEIWEFFKQFPAVNVGTNEQAPATLDVWPNPVQDRLFLSVDKAQSLVIYDVHGKMTSLEVESDGSCSVAHLATGAYFGSVGNQRFSFVKN